MARTLGAVNRTTRRLKIELEMFLYSAEYQASMKARIIAGQAQQLEVYLWQMLHGKPRESLDLRLTAGTSLNEEDFSQLTLEELHKRAEEVATQIKDAKECEDALPAEYKLHKPVDDGTLVRPQDPPAQTAVEEVGI